MKTLYLCLLLAILCFASPLAAQDAQLYKENFSSSAKGITPIPAYSWYPAEGAWRTQHSTQASTRKFQLNNSISTIGYTDISVSWDAFRSSVRQNKNWPWVQNNYALKLSYSINGGPFKPVTGWYEEESDYNVWNEVNGGRRINLPQETANVKNLKLAWEIKVAGNLYFAIDNISIAGTEAITSGTVPGLVLPVFQWNSRPQNENPMAASGSASATPYRLDGVAMRISQSVAAGVSIIEAKVSRDRFQNPKSSFTLVQKGATATKGTEVVIAFEQPIADLSFSLFDMDQQVGQFQDKVLISGIGTDGKIIKLKAEDVKSASATTKYVAASGEVISESRSEIAPYSELGNTRFSFAEPVKQVNINYLNNDAASGQQGIGIYNIYGRSMPASLPVELINFKGKESKKGVELTWATAMELNNDKFVVERSLDGVHFTAQGHIMGHGHSATMLNYGFTDATTAPGTYYYRLRQLDTDGTETYSKTIALEVNGNASYGAEKAATLYPTLATQQVTVQTNGAQGSLLIVDASGRTISTLAAVTGAAQVVPVQHLQPGLYFAVITTAEHQQTLRFIKK